MKLNFNAFKVVVATIAFVSGSSLYFVFPSLAADPIVDAPPEPPAAPDAPVYSPMDRLLYAPVYDWSGAYVGLTGGYQNPGSNENGPEEGFLGGVYLGYNIPAGSFVIGPEIDFAYYGGTESYVLAGVRHEFDAHWQGSIRLRAGVPIDEWLVYATGGLEVARGNLSWAGGSDQQIHFGWTAGGGIERAFSENLIGRFEVRYSDFGTQTYNSPVGPVNVDFSQIKATIGIGYKF